MEQTEKRIKDFNLIGGKSMAVVIDGEPYVLRAEHPNFRFAVIALMEGDPDKLKSFMTLEGAIAEYLEGTGVEVKNDRVYWNGKEMNGMLAERILNAMSEGIDATPFINFLNKLMQNPSDNSRAQLFKFVEKCGLTITPEGDFLGYKAVRKDYMDKHSGRFDNHTGNTLSMLRENVVDDESIGCGPGLHVGTFNYAHNVFGGGQDRVMIVAVNPSDVVSVPRDYEWQKLRCCQYTVVGEFTREFDEAVCDEYSDHKVERHNVAVEQDLVNWDSEAEED